MSKSLGTAFKAIIKAEETAVPYLMLFELQITPGILSFFLTSNTRLVEFKSQFYRPAGIKIGKFKEDTKGNISELSVGLNTTGTTITRLMDQHDGFAGKTLTVRIVHHSLLSDTGAFIEESFQVISGVATENNATLRVGQYNLLKEQFPRKVYNRTHCRFVYKDTATCQYSGGLATCSKMLNGSNGCEAHSNEFRFGGFPGISV